MLFTSPVFSQVSGSIAGLTYAHGRSGLIVRARSTPTDRNSQRQRIIRAAVASLAPQWGRTLTTNQRAAWELYASNISWTNKLGQTTFLTGHQHFLRCNLVRIQGGITLLNDAPEIYDLGTFTAPTIQQINTDEQLALAFDNTDDWATAVGGYLLCWPGRPCNPSRTFYRSPWRYGGKVSGAVVPPASPGLINVRWPCAIVNILWCYCRIIQVDGRMSMPIVLGPRLVTEGGKGDGNPDGVEEDEPETDNPKDKQ